MFTQFCCKHENIFDMEQDCIKYGKRVHSFWDDPVRDVELFVRIPTLGTKANRDRS